VTTVTTEGAVPVQAGLQRADGVELIGEMAGSGYRVPPSLVRRGDGQVIQLTPLLYAIVQEVDGRRTPAEVAAAVSASTGRDVSEENVDYLVDHRLRPLGLMVGADGSQPAVKKRNPLLGLRFRYAVTDPDRTRRLTAPFQFLFRPWVAVPVLAAFAVICWWVFFHKGLASAAYDAFERPGLLILVFAVTIVSAGFHEFGHAAAARYGGATPGVMGFGVYLVWPAFYTDVTDSYRLGRAGRLRTDLGGLYFNAIVAVAITGLWWWLRYDALLLVVATQILQMLRQLAPMVRFDGYHVLADTTGVPDLYSRIKPTLLGMLPWRWRDPQARMLKPWARTVVTLWVMVVIPLLLSTLATAVIALPRVIGTAWSSLGKQRDILLTAWADGDIIQATARVLAIVAIVIPVAGVIYLLVRLARRSILGAWRGTAGKPVMRALAVLLGGAVFCAVAYAWSPHGGNYRPIQPGERGTIGDIAYALGMERMREPRTTTAAASPASASRALVKGQRGVMQAVWDTRTPPPTFTQPQLAVILVPRATPGASVGGGGGSGAFVPATNADQGWVFPVSKPLAPEPGDTQALAVNTTDNTVEYEAAFAMVWVENDDAMNVNEAQAYASCDSCAAVAVAYQVVFVVDTDETDDNVAAPQNLAGALNYDCANCLTYALAQQVFITLDRPLTDEEKAKLDEVWAQVKELETRIDEEDLTLEEVEAIDDQLAEYTAQIKEIVGPAMATTTAPSTVLQTASQTAAPAPSSTASPTTPSPTPSATATPSPSATASTQSTAPSTATSSSAPTTASTEPTGTTSEPTGSTDSTSTGTSGGSTGGTTSGDSTSDGSTSGGTGTAP
jgi:putative peptide zinc metalloprotease protein